MAQNLAPIYVNNERVRVNGEPKPKVATVIERLGKQAADVEVYRLQKKEDPTGRRLQPEDIIDRTMETDPVFLRLLELEKEGLGTGVGPVPGPAQPIESGGEPMPAKPPTGGPSPTKPEPSPNPGGPQPPKARAAEHAPAWPTTKETPESERRKQAGEAKKT